MLDSQSVQRNKGCADLLAGAVLCRYDDLSSASDNIDLQTTILSRFDLIFIVRDVPDEQRDQDIAK
jgi:DNA replication licensing factor MCM5